MLPIQIAIQTQEATADQVVTTTEAQQLMATVFGSVIGAMLITFGMVMFNRVLGSNPGGNPSTGNPGDTTETIISRAGLKEYEYKWFPEPEEEGKHRVYAYTRRRWVGSYEIVMFGTKDTCMIKMYEYLEGGKRRLQATWSGISKEECANKFEKVCEVVKQVRFEHKTALMR